MPPRQNPLKPCECTSQPSPYLVFDKSHEESPIIKRKLRDQWKSLEPIKSLLMPTQKQLGAAVPEEAQEEIAKEEPSQPSYGEELRRLFESMLNLGMDRHALAISANYRMRPQACVCDEECCICFDYSPFLHNLKLHNHKELLKRNYSGNIKGRKTQLETDTKGNMENKQGVREKTLAGMGVEFGEGEDVEKEEEDDEAADEDHSDLASLDRAILDRVRRQMCAEKPPCHDKKNQAPQKKRVKLWTTKPRLIRAADGQPPYETKFNSIHARVREFETNRYKTLIREEMKQLNELSPLKRKILVENLNKNSALRPRWRL